MTKLKKKSFKRDITGKAAYRVKEGIRPLIRCVAVLLGCRCIIFLDLFLKHLLVVYYY